MQKQPLKVLVFILLLAFYGGLLVHQIDLPWGYGNDLGRHINNGEMLLKGHTELLYKNFYSYTIPEQRVVNHHWFSGVVFYLVKAAIGWEGLVIFKTLVLLLAFLLLFRLAAEKSNFWLAAVFAVPAIYLLGLRTQARPEMFSYLFAVLFLYLLFDFEKNPGRKRIYWLIPIQVFWVNMHLFFPLGIAIAGAFLVEKLIKKQFELTKKLFLLIAFLFVSCLINPNGISGALAPLNSSGNFGIGIGELKPLSYFLNYNPPAENIWIAIFCVSLLILIISFIIGFRQKNIFWFIVSMAAGIGGIMMNRLVPLFGIAFLPAAAINFSSVFLGERKQLVFTESFYSKFRLVCQALFIFILCCLIYYGASGRIHDYKKPGLGVTAQSESASKFFKANNLHGPIFNDFDIGGYLIYSFYPGEKVFTDNRPEAYPFDFFQNHYARILSDESTWQKALQQYQFNVIFFAENDINPHSMKFIENRAADPAWVLVFADKYAIIFLRNNPENQNVIAKYFITPENVKERMQPLLSSEDYTDRTAGAEILSLMGRPDLGIAALFDIVSKWPDKGSTWKLMGQMQLQASGNYSPILAMMFLDKAISTGWRTPDTYTSLAEAYLKLGKKDKAEEALHKALKKNPDDRAAQELMKQVR
jgi:tetratricopeptide (TPR) repeat protein